LYVRKSLDWWSSIFELPEVPFVDPAGSPCMEIHRAVKSLLAACPSKDQREIMAFQSIKKGLPDSCPCMEKELLDGLVANIVGGRPPVLPHGYLAFVKKQIRVLFPKGWDSDYEGYCRRFAPPLKGVLEAGRSGGGSLGVLRNRHELDHSDFLEVALMGRPFRQPLAD